MSAPWVPFCNDKGERGALPSLFNRLGGVVVKAGLSVFLFDEIKPVRGGVLEKIGVDSGTSPEPAFFGGPEPEISI